MKKQFSLLSWMLLLAMLLGIMPPQLSVYAAQADKTLSQITATGTQKGSDIKAGDSIDSEADLSVRVSFELPELSDGSANLLKSGDTASIKLTNAFTLISIDSVALMNGDVSVGRVNFETNPDTRMVIAKVLFDLDEAILVEAMENHTFNFSIKFKYNTAGDAGKTGDHSVKILDEKYTVTIIAAEPVESTQPEATQPEVTQPKVTQPEVTQPDEGSTQPEITTPESSIPIVSKPGLPSTKPAGTPAKPGKPSPTIQSDVSANLLNITSVISQNGTPILPGMNLISTDLISVAVSFDIPVEGDDPTPANPVHLNDTAVFELSSSFVVPTGGPIELKAGNIVVGHLTFSTNPAGVVIATVVFDGDPTVFDGTSNSVKAQFNANFAYDNSGDSGSVGDHQIIILDKTYNVVVPPPPIVYEMAKVGVVDLATGKINWKVTVNATQGGVLVDLKGHKFSDDLTNVGTYVAGSFKIGAATVAPQITGNSIAYVFPTGSMSPQVVEFATTIPVGKLYASTEQTTTNKAQLYDETTVLPVKESIVSVKFTPKWISKGGTTNDTGSSGVYTPTDRTIIWTITANLSDLALNNVVIKDVLPTGLDFQSATIQTWNGTSWNPATTIDPVAGLYSVGNINSRVLLTIVTKVPDAEYQTDRRTFTNTASMTWDGSTGTGPGTGGIGVGIGFNAISKTGVQNTKTGTIKWSMNVDTRGQIIPELKVYDLLVYAATQDLTGATGFPAGVERAKLVPQYNQKFIEGTFSGGTLTYQVIPILKDGVQVADLIEVANFSMTQANPFIFDTQVLNPAIYAGNVSTDVKNTITLHSAGTWINQATGTVAYKSQILSKELLKREATADPAQGVNSQITTNAADAFDYNNKTVIYRLTVNADGMDLTNMKNAAGESLGTVTLTDTLPVGWEFVSLTTADFYQVFEGVKSGTTVNAVDTTPDTVAGLTANFTGGTATFTFNPLTKPYVILVRAKPTDSVLAGYFAKNATSLVTNTLALKTQKWAVGPSVTRNVSITSELFSKSQKKVTDGVLNWSVVYKPYDIPGTATRMEDLIPQGLALRTDSNGNPILAGNITVTELTLNPNGTYTDGAQVPLVLGGNLTYDISTRILTFKIPNSAKAYRLDYITDITGEPGTVTNKAILYGSDEKLVEVSTNYLISSADGSASLKRNGWFEITKQDGAKKALAGVEFTLFTSDGLTILRKGTTTANGTVRFRVIPDGAYIFRETATLPGYTLDTQNHTLNITTVGGVITTSIDGKTGTDSNKITIKNFLENTVGQLILSKSVAGSDGDLTKKFEFTVTFTGAAGTYDYIGLGVPNGIIKSGDKVSLAHGQSITILGLPKTSTYKVVETNYSAESYVTQSTGETGTIIAGETKTAAFTNTKNLGKLTVGKTVLGNDGDLSKKFDFTITFIGAPLVYNYTGNGVPNGTIQSGGKVSLANNQSITILGLPTGATYTITEADYAAAGYVTTNNGATGTIETGLTKTVTFTNTKNVGSLAVTKSVPGKTSDKTKKFTFTITFTGAPGVYPYLGTGVPNGTIVSGGTISLANGESILINGLPTGATYTVVEADYLADGYVAESTGATGKITTGETITAAFVNNKVEGELTIAKSVTGNAGSATKKFDFTVTFQGATGSYPYTGNGVPNGTIQSGGTISLAKGESITIGKLPMGTTYTVTEADYSGDGYVLAKTGDVGTIVADEPQTASFTNTKNVGSLTVSKTVQGNAGDQSKLFAFTITVAGAASTYAYTGSGIADGTFVSGNTISLAGGQSITIVGLPAGATYTVTEAQYTLEGYVTSQSGATGTIETGLIKTASFTNTKNVGSLEITKTVPGKTSDKTKAFTFTITLIGAPGEYAYEGTGGIVNGTIKSGDTVSLTHGQSILIKGLPAGATYSVVEADYFADGYIPEMTGDTGTIVTGQTQVAGFSNIKVVGELVISKSVRGNDGDPAKQFAFTITFDGAPGTYAYKGIGGAPDGLIRSGDTVRLTHGQSIMISGLPKDAKYTVTEADYRAAGYVTEVTGNVGTIVADEPQNAVFINTRNIGSLVITKTVPGKTADKTKAFNFTITFSSAPGTYAFIGTNLADGTIQSGDTIALTHGQSILINGLPEGTTYTVVEADYLADGYQSTGTATTGTIETAKTKTADFINTKIEGELTISKSVTGNAGSLEKAFDFTVTFEGATGVYPYTGNGVADGTIQSGDTIGLLAGQSITIGKLPQGTTYTVTEADYSVEGYLLEKTGAVGTIVADEPLLAAFTNTKNVGSLTVTKTVGGNAGDLTKSFNFTITVDGARFVYAYTGNGVSDGNFRNGDTISLADGQSITILGLPANAAYSIVEANYWPAGYVTTQIGETGTIQTGLTKTAAFSNTKNIGSLEISKTVPGNTSDKTKAFEFTVTLNNAPGEYAYEGTGVSNGTIKSGDKVSLAHGQSILIKGLPADATYSVVETNYFADGYIPEMTGDTGTIVTGETQVAAFKNIKVVGELVISKTVNGNDGDPTKRFGFTVTFEGTTGSFAYTGNGVADGMIASGDTIFLKHGQSIMIKGLPKDTKYTIVEGDYSLAGYVTEATGDTGTIVADEPQNAAFTNTRNIGSLAITKTVPGKTSDKNKPFNFTITFGIAPATYTYTGTNIADGTIKSGDTIALTDGQSILINGLPAGTTYTVVEADYLADGYVAVSTGSTGVIETGETKTAAFINNKVEGELTITKTVAGNAGDLEKKFNFTVTFQGADGSYPYTGDGVPDGTIKSGDTIALAHGQSITILKLPMDATYTVTEQDYSYEGYVVEKAGDVGTIVADEPQTATFANTKNIGSLTITKTVPGKTSDKTKAFDFTVTFTGAPAEYAYVGNGVPDGTIKSGDTISLADGQSITIVGLPEHAFYEVNEKDYTGEGYIAVTTGNSGTIVTDETQIAAFANIKIVGELVISKMVKGNGGDLTKKFAFTITFEGTTEAFSYKGNGVPGGTIQSGDTIYLANGQSIMISGLPKDIKYKVTEADYSAEGYVLEATGDVGMIMADEPQIAAFINTKNIGSLAIEKTVKGNGGETDRLFKFTVTFTNAPGAYAYQKNGVDAGVIKSGDTISLTHGQIITIAGLPTGATYVVTENDYSGDGYLETKTGDTGMITTGETSTAAFVNTKGVGSLSVTKILKGVAPNKAKAFEFTVILEGTSATYSYVGNGVPNGQIKSGDKIALANGQSITINGLPVGMNYSVTEKDYLRDGFEVVSVGATGKITLDKIQEAIFTNTYNAELDFNIPQTGDTLIGNYAKIGLFFFSGALLSLAAAYYVLRKRQRTNKS